MAYEKFVDLIRPLYEENKKVYVRRTVVNKPKKKPLNIKTKAKRFTITTK